MSGLLLNSLFWWSSLFLSTLSSSAQFCLLNRNFRRSPWCMISSWNSSSGFFMHSKHLLFWVSKFFSVHSCFSMYTAMDSCSDLWWSCSLWASSRWVLWLEHFLLVGKLLAGGGWEPLANWPTTTMSNHVTTPFSLVKTNQWLSLR